MEWFVAVIVFAAIWTVFSEYKRTHRVAHPENQTLQSVCLALRDPTEEWVEGSYTLDNPDRGISVWISGGVEHVSLYAPARLKYGYFQRKQLWEAVQEARANMTATALGVNCSPKELKQLLG